MKQATHSGHCQACGRLQKLPSGVLSLHGYKVAHGFFSGVCVGARELPFEQSCGLVAQFIASAKRALATLEAKQAELRSPAVEPFTTINVYVKGQGYGQRGHYEWQRVQVNCDVAADGHRTFYLGDRRDHTSVIYDSYGETALTLATRYNKRYADSFNREAETLRRYIAWQTERVATWEPAALLPVTAKDKEGFAADAA